MTVEDVYLFALHEPYHDPQHAVAINATIVHARTLLHSTLPQPDAGLIYRCLTEFPGRTPGTVVPLSTLTHELGGGRWWPRIGDWEGTVEAVVGLARAAACDAMPIGLPEISAGLLASGPNTTVRFVGPDGQEFTRGPADRARELAELSGHVARFAAEGPFWPGDNLLSPPVTPATLPYDPTS